ncbi:6-bladed beta-propeller [Methanomethylovorans sp.]|uniref:6-bladed beta-propeller n=1 Tax=Methanomethylovorans sp. TaxID=2758717 RepID=UPI003D143ECD
MIKTLVYFVLILLLPVTGCKVKVLSEYELDFESLQAKECRFDEVFSLKKILILEETTNSLLSDIVHIKVHKNNFYVSDNQHVVIYRFSENGKFLNSIGKQGRGPGELLTVLDFQVDESTVWAMDLYKFVVFDHEGHFLREYAKPVISFDFIHDGDSNFLIYNINSSKWPQIMVKDSLFKTIRSFSSMHYNQQVMPAAGRSYLFNDNKDVFLTYPFSDTIYRISDTTATPFFIFGFGEKRLRDYNSLYGGNFDGDLSKYSYSIKDFITEDYLVSTIAVGEKVQLLILDRRSGKTRLIDAITNGPDLINKSSLLYVDVEGNCYWGYNSSAGDSTFKPMFNERNANENTALIITKIIE